MRADKDFAVPLEVIARDEGGIEYKLAASIFVLLISVTIDFKVGERVPA